MLYIVDDEIAIRDSIHRLATSQTITVTAYDSCEAFLTEINRTRCSDPQGECLLLNIRIPIMIGTALLYAVVLRDLMARLPVILIADHDNIPMAVDMLKQGAFDYFEKPFNQNELMVRVKKALAVSREEQTLLEMNSRLAVLTAREREILDLILAGNINRAIGDKLGISTRTVEVHRANILNKTQVRNAMELARMFK